MTEKEKHPSVVLADEILKSLKGKPIDNCIEAMIMILQHVSKGCEVFTLMHLELSKAYLHEKLLKDMKSQVAIVRDGNFGTYIG